MSAFFSKLFTIFQSKIEKNAVFALCFEISIADVTLRLNFVRKCHFAIAELRCATTESKSSLRKLRCGFGTMLFVSTSDKILYFSETHKE